jgi:tetratricopeptide (TPR) repeat protein
MIARWFAPVSLALLYGCASAPSPPVIFDPESYALLLEMRQFEQASSSLALAPGVDDEMRQQLQRQVDMAAQLYVEDLLNSARVQQREGQWYQAGLIYREGMDALPGNIVLEDAYADYARQKQAYVDVLQQQIKLHRAKMLPEEISLTRQLSEVDPRDQRLQNKLFDMEREADQLVVFMTPLAQQAYDSGDFKLARQYDQQILTLGESPQSRARLAFIDAKLSRDAQRAAQGRQKAEREKRERLWRNYEAAMASEDYLQARAVLDQLAASGGQPAAAQQERARLEALINEKSIALIAEGKKYYTRGKLDNAIDAWRRALQFNPENPDLIARIKRAETFQANYHRLAR